MSQFKLVGIFLRAFFFLALLLKPQTFDLFLTTPSVINRVLYPLDYFHILRR